MTTTKRPRRPVSPSPGRVGRGLSTAGKDALAPSTLVREWIERILGAMPGE